MSRRLVPPLISGVLVVLAAATVVEAGAKQERKVRAARWIYEELLLGEDRVVPDALLRETRCLAIFPDVTEAALGLGGSFGRGVASCRRADGGWSAPAFLKISGGSIGLQAGFRRVDLVMFFVSEKGARTLAKSHFSFGGQASVAAGPIDRRAGVSADTLYEEDVYLYARARGLFAGASLEGTRLSAGKRASREYYGDRHWPEEILFGGKIVAELPPEGDAFVQGLAGLPPAKAP